MTKDTSLSQRKTDHLDINLQKDVTSDLTTGLEKYQFEHCALPELDMSEIDTGIVFMGKKLWSPLLISSMTGGTDEAWRINRNLAIAAQENRIAMGVGSQRAGIHHPETASTFKIRSLAPDAFLMANLGAIQLNYGYGIEECLEAVEMIQADALILHLNPLQEALQPEGDTNWKGLFQKIARVVKEIPVPVIIKEVGWGISGSLAVRLADIGVAAVDVAGAGGTSWSQVEMYRLQDENQRQTAASFRGWGIPTADAIQQVATAVPQLPIIASGGLRNGIDIAKSIALGADIAGMAGTLLKAAAVSADETSSAIHRINREIKITMFAAGIPDISDLKHTLKLHRSS